MTDIIINVQDSAQADLLKKLITTLGGSARHIRAGYRCFITVNGATGPIDCTGHNGRISPSDGAIDVPEFINKYFSI